MISKEFIEDFERTYKILFTARSFVKKMILSRNCRFLFVSRNSNFMLFRFLAHHYEHKYGLEIHLNQFGAGVVLAHPYNITVNGGAKIGKNCTIFKGATIGSVRSGKRQGVPIIHDNVVIGVNAFVGGGVEIGNDVLIAANAFCDFDVPDHSIVIGNPGIIKHKENATIDYQ